MIRCRGLCSVVALLFLGLASCGQTDSEPAEVASTVPKTTHLVPTSTLDYDQAEPASKSMIELPAIEIPFSDGSGARLTLKYGAVSRFGSQVYPIESDASSCAQDLQRDAYIPFEYEILNTTSGFSIPLASHFLAFEAGGRTLWLLDEDSQCVSDSLQPLMAARHVTIRDYREIPVEGALRGTGAVILENFFNPSAPDGSFADPAYALSFSYVQEGGRWKSDNYPISLTSLLEGEDTVDAQDVAVDDSQDVAADPGQPRRLDPSIELLFDEAALGPIRSDTLYQIGIRTPTDATLFQPLVDGVPQSEPASEVPPVSFVPGMHMLQIALTTPTGEVLTREYVVYALGQAPSDTWRVTLATVGVDEGWAAAIMRFQALLDDGHDQVRIYPSVETPGNWDIFVDGFESSAAAGAYCAEKGLDTGEACLVSFVEPGGG